ncbi:MAG TPA: hypothetical protein VK599_05295 [Streptosporangiaceae bacterium]|nr:hypothetical protein [Streptosporangiaceae bacterium]
MRIPSPWSGDENDPTPHSYRAWFWLYATTRKIRHALGLHDWEASFLTHSRKCTWCGTRRNVEAG